MRTTYRQATNLMTTMTSARPEVRHDLGAQYPRQKLGVADIKYHDAFRTCKRVQPAEASSAQR